MHQRERGKEPYAAGKIDEAIGELQRAKLDAGSRAEAGYWLAQAFGVKKKIYKIAVLELVAVQRALDGTTDLWKNATYLLARLHEAAGERELALAEYRKLALAGWNRPDGPDPAA